MNVLEAIRSRRSVRAYSNRVVEEATIRALVDAAILAPNAMNEQTWIFAVVQDKKQLDRWSKRAKGMLLDAASQDPKTRHYSPLLADPSFNVFYDASTLVVIGSRSEGTYASADCWLAAENLMLAACEVGLGSCPIGFAIPLLNTREAKDELRFPSASVVVAPILLGYPAGPSPAVPRNPPQILSWTR